MWTSVTAAVALGLVGAVTVANAQAGNDLINHGEPVTASSPRGVTAAVDGEGNRVVLAWLSDGGTRSQLVINADTGEAKQVPVEPYEGDNPFVVLHSSGNKWYSAFGGHFYEFDIETLRFTFAEEMPGREPDTRMTGMGITQDHDGIVWLVTYPDPYLISYDPETQELTNHALLNEESWAQYALTIAIGDDGWIYAGIGNTAAQIAGYNRETGETRTFIPEDRREHGGGRAWRAPDGQVYARDHSSQWYAMNDGEATEIEGEPEGLPSSWRDYNMSERDGRQGSVFADFPDGSRIVDLDLELRTLELEETDGSKRVIEFDYEASATRVAAIGAGPDGKVYGSTSHPGRLFVYDPANDQLIFYPRESIALKSVVAQGEFTFGGHYSGGILYAIDTTRPTTLPAAAARFGEEIDVEEPAEDAEDNPRSVAQFAPDVNLPRHAFAHPDGRHVIVSGQPGYGLVGGGLGIYDLERDEATVLTHEDLLPHYSTMGVAALPDGNLLCVTSPRGGHGTTPEHDEAAFYILDWHSREVIWDSGPIEGVEALRSLVGGPDGLYYAVSAEGELLVFHPRRREVVHTADLSEYGSHVTNQAMTVGPDGHIYVALSRALVRIQPRTLAVHELVRPNGGIQAGIAITDGRVYFASGGRLMSVRLP